MGIGGVYIHKSQKSFHHERCQLLNRGGTISSLFEINITGGTSINSKGEILKPPKGSLALFIGEATCPPVTPASKLPINIGP
jgi:hypothetical protein